MTALKVVAPEKYIGLSTDTKPTNVRPGATFFEYDTKLLYVTYDDGSNWTLKDASPFVLGSVAKGTVSTYTNTTTFAASDLSGFGDGYFKNWWVYPVWDAGGAGAAPQGEMKQISAYTSSTGTFTHSAFTTPLAATDKVLILHPSVADVLNSTYGLSALKTLIGTPAGASLAADLLTIDNLVDDLETRLSAARAGYLDELAAANIPTDIDGLKTSRDRQLFSMVFESAQQATADITNSAGDVALPDVTVADLPSGVTVVRAIAFITANEIYNTSGSANQLAGSQSIQIRTDTPGAWTNCITFADNLYPIAASTITGFGGVKGAIDVATTVTANDTYNFQWTSAVADQSNLQLRNIQTGIIIWYSI